MESRILPKQVLEKKPQPNVDIKISFIETKIFLKKQMQFVDGDKISADEKIKTSSQLAVRVRMHLREENADDRAIITENLKDIFGGDSFKTLVTLHALKTNVEHISEASWFKAKEIHHLYLVRFLAGLHRYKNKIKETQYDKLFTQAALSLHEHSLEWATKSKGWAEAFEAAIKPVSPVLTSIAGSAEVEQKKESLAKKKESTEQKKEVKRGHFRNGCEGMMFGLFSGAAGAFICNNSLSETKSIATTAAIGSGIIYALDNQSDVPITNPERTTEFGASIAFSVGQLLSGALGNFLAQKVMNSEQTYSQAMFKPALGAAVIVFFTSWIYSNLKSKNEKSEAEMKPRMKI